MSKSTEDWLLSDWMLFSGAWSSAKMALRRAEMEMEEASDQWFIDHFRSAGSTARGDYERCLRNWQAVFPESSFLVLRFEDLVHQPIHLLERCCNHLNVDTAPLSAIESIYTIVFQGEPHSIRPSLLPVLHELYDEKTSYISDFFESRSLRLEGELHLTRHFYQSQTWL